MEGNSSDLVREASIQMDQACQSVMPDYWEGHSRLAIRQSDAVPQRIEEKTVEKARQIAEDKDVSLQRATKALIKNLKERQE